MWIKQTEWVSLLSLVTRDTDREIWGNLAGAALTAGTASDSWANYAAGAPNYTLLNMKETEFSDPLEKEPYLVWVTTTWGWRTQFITLTEGDGTTGLTVSWNYVARTIPTTVPDNATATVLTSKKVSMLSDIGRFKKGDTLNVWVVESISDNLETLTLKENATAATAKIQLAQSEEAYLVEDKAWAAIDTDTTGEDLY
jgi:hypothetical protein